jgi:hypothetical protein
VGNCPGFLMRLRITGNSHVGALKHGAEKLGLFDKIDLRIAGCVLGVKQARDFYSREGDHVRLWRSVRSKKFAAEVGSNCIGPDDETIWGICMLPLSERLYTEDVVPTCAEMATEPLLFLRDLHELGVHVFAIMTPPPRRDNKDIPEWRPLLETQQIDLAYREWLRKCFTAIGIHWFEAPADEAGFQKPEHYKELSQDHANAEYGAVLMQQIMAHYQEELLGRF